MSGGAPPDDAPPDDAPLVERLADRIRTVGPLRFSAFLDAALYDANGGFYAAGGRAGRRGDFLTSAEVGPLFGAVVARAVDRWWHEAGEPAAFTMVDAGAGPGTLARAVLSAGSRCRDAGALRYVAVERSAAQRASHPSGVSSVAELPAGAIEGVVLANELLDNLPFDIVVWDGGWRLAMVDADREPVAGDVARFVERLVPLPPDVSAAASCLPASAAHGARAPLLTGAVQWLGDTLGRLAPGSRLVVFDYARPTTAELVSRPWRSWLRTYRAHERGTHPLVAPGSQDITSDVALDQLATVRPPDRVVTQARWLAEHGIGELVDEGKRLWLERGHTGDLAALRARSRLREGDALTDPDGLGGFTVAEWTA